MLGDEPPSRCSGGSAANGLPVCATFCKRRQRHLSGLNLVAAGGVVSAEEWPLLDYRNGACIGDRVRALEHLADIVKPESRH
jgi:hypothetical protein